MLMSAERPVWLPALSPGERLLWQGQASRRLVVFRLSDVPHVLTGFVLLVVGLRMDSLFGDFGSLGDDPSPGLSMFDIIRVWFIAFGLFELVGRDAINLLRRVRTSYALTTHRAFIHSGVFRPVTRERPLSPSDPPEFRLAGDGSGTIIFVPPERRRSWSAGRHRGRDLEAAVSAGLDGFQFFGVPDADRVRALLADDRPW